MTRTIPEELRRAFHELQRRHPNASLGQLNEMMDGAVEAYNRRPQAELGGLSPEQARRLLADRWEGEGPVRLAEDLSPDDLSSARTLHDARETLDLLAGQGTVRATPAGNLPRAVVVELGSRFRWGAGDHPEMFAKRPNEQDAAPIHYVRLLLEVARLLKRQRGAFSLTKRGEALRAPERAGELFAVLFRAWFRDFNLAYADGLDEEPGFQRAIAFSLYAFGEAPDEWLTPAELADRLLLPAVRESLPPPEELWSEAEMIVQLRLLRWLERFGLAEVRTERGKGPFQLDTWYRRTRLFSRFFHVVF